MTALFKVSFYYCYYLNVYQCVSILKYKTDCNNTRIARDRDIFIVTTIVTAPAAVLTVCDTCFTTTAPNVVQPNFSFTGTVAVVN